MYIPLEEYNLYGEQYYNKYSKKKKKTRKGAHPKLKKCIRMATFLLFCFALCI